MNLNQLSKVMHAARLARDGAFKTQLEAAQAIHIDDLQGRVSDATTILNSGCPELIAAVESGQIPFATGWHIARGVPFDEQVTALKNCQISLRRSRHGLYAGRTREDRKPPRAALQKRACAAIDKLLEAIGERADALEVCTNGIRLEPEPEQARNWRRNLNRCRKALTRLEKSVDWTKSEILQGAGENHDASNNGTQ